MVTRWIERHDFRPFYMDTGDRLEVTWEDNGRETVVLETKVDHGFLCNSIKMEEFENEDGYRKGVRLTLGEKA